MEYIVRRICSLRVLTLLLSLGIVWSSCRREDDIIKPTNSTTGSHEALRDVGAFYLLNEGNMGSNKATLDYYDYTTGNYLRNIFAARNPSVKKELGDVGNDLKLYGSRLWAVINNSHLVEVMEASTAKHIGTVGIANCRYVTFRGRYAYISSYAGEIKLDPNARLGYIAKIDTATLQEVGRCAVGYQPEEMAIVGHKLYVANSGGYRVPNYDNRITVIDLNTFTVEKEIEVAINLHRLRADASGMLWVSSRGDYKDTPSRLFVVDPESGKTVKTFELTCSNMWLDGTKLYGYGQAYHGTKAGELNYFIIDTQKRELISEDFLPPTLKDKIVTPYGIAVNPDNKDILLCDAGSYTTPGKIYAISSQGTLKWVQTTGNIPNSIVFLPRVQTLPFDQLSKYTAPEAKPWDGPSPYITRVFAYCPAPGQHVNKLPEYAEGDTEERMRAKVLEAIGNNAQGMISLGSWGGYVDVGFDHTIKNEAGKRDFRVLGNTLTKWAEPGVVYVAYDANKNGRPDEGEWYEIAGSASREYSKITWLEDQRKRGKDVAFYRDYEVTYHRPTAEGKPKDDIPKYIAWENNKGATGFLPKNEYHSQSYYPLWLKANSYTLRGVRLPQNGYNSKPEEDPKGLHILLSFAYGYADNVPNTDEAAEIDIDWAVDKDGRQVKLSGVDFVRIQTGIHQVNGWLGECSTEVTGVEDLHILSQMNQ